MKKGITTSKSSKKMGRVQIRSLLISCIVVLVALIFTLPFVIINGNKGVGPTEVEQGDTKQISGVYYATAQEVEESGVAQVPMSEKGGAIYVGSGSTYTMSGGCIKSQHA
ncbi:MAG: hypothetical protein IJS74_02565, partial [Clostridia bacterium]|nr:hypothetical protein [Clostridia bacterium]